MPQTMATQRKREPVPLNGVDTPALFATIDVVKGRPERSERWDTLTSRHIRITLLVIWWRCTRCGRR
jgi:hypothetical protein